MKEISTSNFGLVIAYLLPGFVALIGVSFFSETVRIWLTVSPSDAPTVGGFLYVTLASLAAGLTVSTIRCTLIDFIHHRTGISEPNRDFSKLQDKLSAYQYLVETHYYFYNFYGGMVIAVAFTFVTLIGVSFFSETVRIWLTVSPSDAPTVGGFLYVTIASVALGMTVGSVRWLVIDTIHHRTGIQQPQWDFSRLQENITAYRTLGGS